MIDRPKVYSEGAQEDDEGEEVDVLLEHAFKEYEGAGETVEGAFKTYHENGKAHKSGTFSSGQLDGKAVGRVADLARIVPVVTVFSTTMIFLVRWL